MGADEEGTHERLKVHFQQLINPKFKEHQGRVVKNTGDGLLAEFASIVDAVRCAAEVVATLPDTIIVRALGSIGSALPEHGMQIGVRLCGLSLAP
jgi:class 3 adenylate cyclase